MNLLLILKTVVLQTVILVFAFQAHGNSCESYIGDCDFYLCQEEKNPCGIDGYNLSYGYKYCNASKLVLLNQMKTSAGKAWVLKAFKCLQRKNLENTMTPISGQDRCENIKVQAYLSHPDCYIEAGFCDLKMSEKARILNVIKQEFFTAKTFIQSLQIIKKCWL